MTRLQKAIFFFALFLLCRCRALTQQVAAPEPVSAAIIGTVVDVNTDPVPSATVTLDGPEPGDHATTKVNDTGFFSFANLRPGAPYHITVKAPGFADWNSPTTVLKPGEQSNLQDVKLTISVVETSVTAMTIDEIALEQVKSEEKQRIIGFIPNFYVAYNAQAVPLPAKLKFRLALHASTDIVTIAGVAFVSGLDHAADTPDYGQGTKAYFQRFGANFADSTSDILIGGAILPALLHQDPRYFYQGTGTTKSRMWHAISAPFVCKGDNGKWQFNASSIGGDLASGALQNLYYPDSDRGAGLVFSSAAISTGGRIANALAQEFLLKKFTSHSNPNAPSTP